jgi:hypothetical protein
MKAEPMKMNLVDKAVRLATQYHDAFRHGSGLPYIVHPMEVMMDGFHRGIRDEAHLAAYVAHDMLEDTNYTYGQMVNDLGSFTANYVMEVSKIGIDHAGIDVKMDFMKTFRGKSIHAILIKMSDRFCNIRDYEKTGNRAWYPAYYAIQAYPLIEAFQNNFENIGDIISKEVAVKYIPIIDYIQNMVQDQYGLNICDRAEENIERIETILRTRDRGTHGNRLQETP